jgi:hypothetical protein
MCVPRANATELYVNRKKQDEGKARFWQTTIGEAARTGVFIREFCRQRRLKESQFYCWQPRLSRTPQTRRIRNERAVALASSALVTGVELVLGDGWRSHIAKGADAATLRAVLAAVENRGC